MLSVYFSALNFFILTAFGLELLLSKVTFSVN